MQSVYRTSALGTSAELVVSDVAALVAASELLHQELGRIDRVASRFRPDSELSRLNARAGRDVAVSEDLLEAVEVAVTMADVTNGLVDPTVGNAMRDIGYDRDFAQVGGGVVGELPPEGAVPGWRSVMVDRRRGTITLAEGVSLDLGATAKALASDRAASTISARLGVGALVSLGGDASVAGPPPEGGFVVGIADTCAAPRPAEAVSIASGGLATSGIAVRQWRLGAHRVHHIVDPATGLPANEYWRTVTVTAASCVQANAASTAAVVLGQRACGWLEHHGLPARLVRTDGSVATTEGWPTTGRATTPREPVSC